MACCLTTPNPILNKCCLLSSKVPWQSSEGITIRRSNDTNKQNKMYFSISLGGQWVYESGPGYGVRHVVLNRWWMSARFFLLDKKLFISLIMQIELLRQTTDVNNVIYSKRQRGHLQYNIKYRIYILSRKWAFKNTFHKFVLGQIVELYSIFVIAVLSRISTDVHWKGCRLS